MTTFNDFLAWEAHTRDTLDVKKIYIDMAGGDVLAGIALSEIVYWHLPNKQGESKMRVQRDDHSWLAIPRWEWWDRVRMTPRQSDRVIKSLAKTGLIKTERWKWNNTPTVHIRIDESVFLAAWQRIVQSPPVNPFLPNGEIALSHQTVKSKTLPNGEMDFTDSSNLKTETTDQRLPETKDSAEPPAAVGAAKPQRVKSEKPPQPHIALIDAWYDGMPTPPIQRKYARNVATAKRILDAGYTSQQVNALVRERYEAGYWQDKQMPLEKVEDDLPLWAKKHQPPTPIDLGDFGTSSEQQQRAIAMRDQLAARVAAGEFPDVAPVNSRKAVA